MEAVFDTASLEAALADEVTTDPVDQAAEAAYWAREYEHHLDEMAQEATLPAHARNLPLSPAASPRRA